MRCDSAGGNNQRLRKELETLGDVLTVIAALTIIAIGLLVLAILVPWFIFRMSTYTWETRDLLKGVKKDVYLANAHLAAMADHLEHLSDLEALKERHTDQAGD